MGVRRDAVGNPDVRPGAALRESERRKGDREHRTHVPGQQETRKDFNLILITFRVRAQTVCLGVLIVCCGLRRLSV